MEVIHTFSLHISVQNFSLILIINSLEFIFFNLTFLFLTLFCKVPRKNEDNESVPRSASAALSLLWKLNSFWTSFVSFIRSFRRFPNLVSFKFVIHWLHKGCEPIHWGGDGLSGKFTEKEKEKKEKKEKERWTDHVIRNPIRRRWRHSKKWCYKTSNSAKTSVLSFVIPFFFWRYFFQGFLETKSKDMRCALSFGILLLERGKRNRKREGDE